MNPLIYQWINFSVLILGLGYLLNKQLGKHFSKERADLEKRISSSKAEFEEMRAEFLATEQMMSSLDSRVEEMKSATLREIQFETKKIELESERAVEKMFLDGEVKAKADIERVKKSLEKELMEKSISSARAALQKDLASKDADWTASMIQQDSSQNSGRKNYAT
ncbi:MAG: hypothetical protein J0L93_00260 [Deltaproteobacteria bacterium]|nr:hypothetical protein [Deltaproteobacteria bacterium]